MLSCFGLVVSVASCHEAWRLSNDRPINHKQDGLAVRCLHCFSVISNGKSILSTKSQPGNVTCLNGLRKFNNLSCFMRIKINCLF